MCPGRNNGKAHPRREPCEQRGPGLAQPRPGRRQVLESCQRARGKCEHRDGDKQAERDGGAARGAQPGAPAQQSGEHRQQEVERRLHRHRPELLEAGCARSCPPRMPVVVLEQQHVRSPGGTGPRVLPVDHDQRHDHDSPVRGQDPHCPAAQVGGQPGRLADAERRGSPRPEQQEPREAEEQGDAHVTPADGRCFWRAGEGVTRHRAHQADGDRKSRCDPHAIEGREVVTGTWQAGLR